MRRFLIPSLALAAARAAGAIGPDEEDGRATSVEEIYTP